MHHPPQTPKLVSFLKLIYTVSSKLSLSLAQKCADLFHPSNWPAKALSYEKFLLVKVYLMTLGKGRDGGLDEMEGWIQGVIQGTNAFYKS